MLFKSLAVISVLAATVAADGAAIAASLNAVDKQTIKVGQSVQSFDGSSAVAALPILIASSQLNDLIKSGTTTANNSAPLSNDEAIALVSPVQQLSTDANNTVNILIAKYPDFKKNNIDGITKGTLQDAQKYAQAYSDAIVAKVPAALQETARNIAAPITQNFARAIKVYSQGGINLPSFSV